MLMSTRLRRTIAGRSMKTLSRLFAEMFISAIVSSVQGTRTRMLAQVSKSHKKVKKCLMVYNYRRQWFSAAVGG